MPRSSREKTAETRARIVETAYRQFIERGYSATSMRDLSQAAGLTVGAIYNHFPTKEDIWREVILQKHPYYEILPAILAAQGDTVEALVRAAAHVLVQELFTRTDLFNLMFIEIVEFQAKHAVEMVNTFLPQLMELQGRLASRAGRLRPIPPPVLIRSFLGLFFSFYVSSLLTKDIPGMQDTPATLDQFVDLYLYGILEDYCPGEGEAK